MQHRFLRPLVTLSASAALLLLVMLTLNSSSAAQDAPPTATPQPDTSTVQVAALPAPDHNCSDGYCVFEIITSTDDAGPAPSNCLFSVTNKEIYFGRCANGTYIVSGFRFPNVTLAPNTVVMRAYLLLAVDGTYTIPLTVNLYGEDATNAAPFDAASQPVARTRLSGVSATWAITDTWPYQSLDNPQSRQTPDVTAIVQAIVNKPGWQIGNALVILSETANTGLVASQHRRVYAYDRQATTANTARLVIYALARKVYLPVVLKN